MIETATCDTEAPRIARQRVQAEGSVSAKPDSKDYIDARPNGASNTESGTSYQPSVIDKLYQQGSARIRFPDSAGSALQAVLINTAGGLTGDDNIRWSGSAAANAHLSISTAACEKIYRSHGPDARQSTQLTVGRQGRLEWLPQESILFNGACLSRTMNVQLEEQSELLLVESLVLGRQAMDETIRQVRVRDHWRIFRNGVLLHAEALRLDVNETKNMRQPSMLHHYGAISTVVFVSSATKEQLTLTANRIRSITAPPSQAIRIGLSVLPSRLVMRVLAEDSYQLRKILIPCLDILNNGRSVPAVWSV